MKYIKKTLALVMALLTALTAAAPAFAESLVSDSDRPYAAEITEADYKGQLIKTDLPSGIYDGGHTLILHPSDGSMLMTYDPDTETSETYYENGDKGTDTRSPDGGFPDKTASLIDAVCMGCQYCTIGNNGYISSFGEVELGALPIFTAYELFCIRYEPDKKYFLARDIDVSDLIHYGIIWSPIPSCASLDGRGHTISGLTDSLLEAASEVKNLTVIVNSSNCCGGIARRGSRIDNCIVKGSISAGEYGYCGGIVGRVVAYGNTNYVITSNPVITNCINYASIYADTYAGGIVGQSEFSSYYEANVNVNTSVSNCINKGSVTSARGAGGIVGRFSCCDVYECINYGRITSVGTKEDVSSISLMVCGIAGQKWGSRGTSIKNCTNRGEVSGYYAYGICHRGDTIENCCNKGNITGEYSASGIGAGGCTRCANFGNITGAQAVGIGGASGAYDHDAANQCINLGNITAYANSEGNASAAGIGWFNRIAYCSNYGNVSAYSASSNAYASGIGSGFHYGITYCNVISDSITAETATYGCYAYAGGIDAYAEHQGGAPHYFGCFKCDTPNISATAPQANRAFAGAFIGYNNTNYADGVGYLATKYCMTNSTLPFSGRSQTNPYQYSIIHTDSLSESYKQVLVKVVNKENGMPLKNAVVNCDGIKVNTDENGIAKVPVCYNRVLLLAVSKNNFECKKIIDPALDVIQVVELAYDGIPDGQPHDFITLPSGVDIEPPGMKLDGIFVDGPETIFRAISSAAFKIELNIDLPYCSMVCKFDDKSKTWKILGGVKDIASYNDNGGFDEKFNEDYNKFSDCITGLMKGNGFLNDANIKELIADSAPEEGKFGLKGEINVMLFAEFSAGEKMELQNSGYFVSLKAQAEGLKHRFWGICYGQIIVSGEINGAMQITFGQGNTMLMTGNTEATVAVTARAVASLVELAKLELGASLAFKMAFNWPFESWNESFSAKVVGTLYVKAKALFWSDKNSWSWDLLTVWPQNKGEDYSVDLDSVLNNENMKPEPRDYLRESGLKSGGNESLVLTGVYPDGSPRLAELSDGRLVLVWAHDDGTRTDMNRTAIYYSVCDNGVWSAPAIVWDDGTADFSPAIAVDGNDLHIVWQNITEVMPDDAELEYMLGKTSLCHTVLHADGTVDTPEAVCPEGCFQSKITMAADNGKVCVSWLQNADNDIWCSSEDVKLYYTELAEGEWSEPAFVRSGVVDAVCGYKDGELEIAYIFNSKVSAQDPAYYDIYRFTRTGNQLLVGNSVEDSHPQIIGGEICWMQDGVLRNTSKSLGLEWDGEVTLAEAPDGTLTAFMLGSGEDFNTEIVTSVYDAQANEWSPIVPLTNYGGAVNWFCPIVLADGNIAAALTESPLTGDDDIFGTASIRVLVGASFTDIMLTDGISYDFDTAAPGGDITLTCTVLNNSMGAVDGLTVNIYDANDALVSTQTLDEYLASGESREISFDYTLPDPLSLATLRAEILPALVTDDEISNNSAEFTVGMSDIALHAALLTEDADGALITAYVINEGFDTAENVTCELVYGGADGETLGTLALGNIAPGGTRDVSFAVPAEYLENSSEFDWNYFTIRVNTESPQAHYYNDYSIVHDEATRAEGIEITTAPAQLYVFDTLPLSANVLPAEAANRRVTWLSGDTSVMTVDENGVVTAIAEGTATIYAVSNDGGFTDSIELTAVCRQYTASFVDWDGTVLASVTVNEGADAEAPEAPEREGYSFVGWDTDFNELHEDIIITAQYEICVYEIYYFIEDELYLVQEYEYGAPVSVPEAPEYEGFVSWGELPVQMPAHDIVVAAIFEPQPPDITPGDLDGDGMVSFNDIAMLYLFLIGDGNIEAALIQNADFNGDGTPTYADITDMYISLIS